MPLEITIVNLNCLSNASIIINNQALRVPSDKILARVNFGLAAGNRRDITFSLRFTSSFIPLNRTSTKLNYYDHFLLQEKVIYHQTMTPSWLDLHASYNNGNPSQTKEYLTFGRVGSDYYAALLKVPMIAAGFLENSAPLTVKIVASHDIATNGNTKIYYGVSDGINFVGFSAVNHGNFGSSHPCIGAHGYSGVPRLKQFISIYGPRGLSDSFFPGQVVLTLKLDERWGSCYTAHDGGFVQTTAYRNRLMPNKGLTLEVYKLNPYDTARIKFIEVTVLEDN